MKLHHLQKLLSNYDKYLVIKKSLDGIITVYRKSPFSSTKEYKVFNLENEYSGSGLHLLRKLSLMDNQRIDIHGQVLENNRKIQTKPHDDRMSKEIADLMYYNEAIVL